MPSYNFAKTIYNKWFQASSNNDSILYITAVNDYIQAFLYLIAYYRFLKGDVGGVGLSKKELKLKCAQCHTEWTGDPNVLQRAFLDMLGAKEFFTYNSHLKGADIFRPLKRKLNMPIGVNNKIHHPNTINFYCPCPGKRITRALVVALSTIIEEASSSMLEVGPPSPTKVGFL